MKVHEKTIKTEAAKYKIMTMYLPLSILAVYRLDHMYHSPNPPAIDRYFPVPYPYEYLHKKPQTYLIFVWILQQEVTRPVKVVYSTIIDFLHP